MSTLGLLTLSKRLTIPSLILSNYVVAIPSLIISLLLVEIALFFEVEVGVAGQLGTMQSIVSATMSLVMGVLSVTYRYKFLLLAGLAFAFIAALACSFAPPAVRYPRTFGLSSTENSRPLNA